MSGTKPEFHLQRVTADGDAGPIEILPVSLLPTSTRMGRRGFLGAGVALGGVLQWIGTPRASGDDSRPAVPKSGDTGGSTTAVLKAHNRRVRGIQFLADGGAVATLGDLEHEIKLWAIADWKLARTIQPDIGALSAFAATTDGKSVASVALSADRLAVNAAASGDRQRVVKLAGKIGNTVELLHGANSTLYGPLCAGGGRNADVKLWLLPEGILRHTFEVKSDRFAVSADGELLAVGQTSSVRIYSLRKLTEQRVLEYGGPVTAVTFSADGTTIFTGVGKNSIRLDTVKDGKPVRTLSGHASEVRSIIAYPDGEYVAAGTDDQVVRIWSVSDGTMRHALDGHHSPVVALAVSADGKLLASGDADGVVIIWDARSGVRLCYLFDPKINTTDAYTYTVTDPHTKKTYTYTMPCGSPLPPGAVCVCNCVPGTYKAVPNALPVTGVEPPAYRPARDRTGGGGWGGGSYCTCNKICTCIPVCQAHRLLHPDPVVRVVAEQLLLLMGEREFGYMRWAAGRAEPPVRTRILDLMTAIRNGAAADTARWPSLERLAGYTAHPDEVVAIMAAQLSHEIVARSSGLVNAHLRERIDGLVRSAHDRPWYVRYGVTESSRLHL